nr:hypothetical protein [Acidobacteriota bacterium]
MNEQQERALSAGVRALAATTRTASASAAVEAIAAAGLIAPAATYAQG